MTPHRLRAAVIGGPQSACRFSGMSSFLRSRRISHLRDWCSASSIRDTRLRSLIRVRNFGCFTRRKTAQSFAEANERPRPYPRVDQETREPRRLQSFQSVRPWTCTTTPLVQERTRCDPEYTSHCCLPCRHRRGRLVRLLEAQLLEAT